MAATIQDDVYRALRNLSSLPDARELLSTLNYTYASAPARVEGLPEATRTAMAGDPQIIAQHGDFKVIHARFHGSRLPLGHEREIITRLLRDYHYSLFLFSDDDDSDWHFVNVKHEGAQATRVFRRLSVGPDERVGDRLRTPADQLADIEIKATGDGPLELQTRHDRAFDVEAVTKRFYNEYSKVFKAVESTIGGIEDTGHRRLFTQRLFNRLMFVAFVQKKGWLELNGQTDYLNELWKSYRHNPDRSGFYNGRLKNLFFVALDNPDGRDYMTPGHPLLSVLGNVRYLNGGLFEQNADDRTDEIIVPDEAVETILNGLFNRFNFTVTESTPLDQEVAVDPEMLGKVFEELVTGRHETGSYYTPKPIVSFMCREALKAYLRARLPDEGPDAIERFVDEHQTDGLRDPEAILEALRNVTACDPACGSGAYLLGLLHELVELRGCLFSSHQVDPVSDYRRKLEIIQKNLYGVDIDPFAVNIARLRLWLSLAIDYDGPRPEPLPNLDFKIEVGDSLTARHVGADGQLALRQKPVEEFQRLKTTFLTAHGDDKRRLYADIQVARKNLADLTHGGAAVHGFDWPVEFAEVFANGGFDVVLANPPYVRQELIKDIKPRLKDVYGPLYSGTADLYVYFYYRALQLLKPGGALAFISSNKWFRAAYGAKLRAHVAETTDVLSITDFGDLPVFEPASAYPMIFTAHKGVPATAARYTEVKSLEPPYPDMKATIEQTGALLPPTAFDGERWMLTDAKTVNLIRTMETNTVTLGEYVNGQIYYGVKTGFNTAFVIDGDKRTELIAADLKSAEIIMPLAVGRDIRRWTMDYRDRWLIVTKIGVDIGRYPAIFEHLLKWEPELKKRQDQGKQWWELRACAYYGAFEKPKIIYPDITKEPRFCFDDSGAYVLNTTYFVASGDTYLLAILNSQLVLEWFVQKSAQIRGGFLRFFRQYVELIPVPQAQTDERLKLASLAQQCADITRDGRGDLAEVEAEINARVARLYGLPEGGQS